MARIIKSTIKPILSLVIRTNFADGTYTDKVLKKDDIVEGLRYVENGEIKSITGRLSDIKYRFNNRTGKYNSISKIRSYFNDDVTPTYIDIDRSTSMHSDIVSIPTREIIEDSGVENVVKIDIFFKYGVTADVLLSNETTNSITIEEGDIVQGLTYLDIPKGVEATVDAKVVAIRYSKPSLEPVALETIANGKVLEILMNRVKSIEAFSTEVTSPSDINEIISMNNGGSTYVAKGVYNVPLVLSESTKIVGAKTGILVSARNVDTLEGETVISGTIDIPENSDITFDGVAITEDALLTLSNAKSLTLKNCIITGLKATSSNNYVVNLANGSETKLVVNGCYFGVNPTTSVGRFKNTLELTGKLKNGSVFSNNYFSAGCSVNNDICIYDVVDGATITIKNNIWEKSENGVRVGTKGDAYCTVNILDNEYYDTSEIPSYAGLLLIQPYGAATTNMSRVTINLDNNTHKDKLQLFYAYSGGNDMPFTDTNKPTVYVNGVKKEVNPIGR